MSSLFTGGPHTSYQTSGPLAGSTPVTDGPLAGSGPAPTVLDSMVANTDAQRLKRIQSLRLGLASTITGAGQGQLNPSSVSVPSLSASPGYAPGNKTLLGQ